MSTVVVYGIECNDPKTAGLVKKVTILSCVLVAMQIIVTIVALVGAPESAGNQVGNLLIGLILPGIGYFSAKNSNVNGICCVSLFVSIEL
jgi:hypothetical protein